MLFSSREVVDIESVSPPPLRPYDADKAVRAMSEAERFADFANPSVDAIDSGDDWEEAVNKYVLSLFRDWEKSGSIIGFLISLPI